MKKRTVKHVLFGTVQYGLMLFYAVFLVLPVFFSFMSSISPVRRYLNMLHIYPARTPAGFHLVIILPCLLLCRLLICQV